MAKATVKDNDVLINKILKEISGVPQINVGVFDDGDPLTLTKAYVNEFGYDSPGIPVTPKMRAWFAYQGKPLKASTQFIKIPARSFIGATFDENLDDFVRLGEELLIEVHLGELTMQELTAFLGAYMVEKVQTYMENLSNPANSDFTIAEKGSDNPLMDTGSLKDSITYKVGK